VERRGLHVYTEADWFVHQSRDSDLTHGPRSLEDFNGHNVSGASIEDFGELGVQHESIRREIHGPQLLINRTAQLPIRR
jgi:hypothetical protein